MGSVHRALQDGQDIISFKRWAYAVTDRLPAVADGHFCANSKSFRDCHETSRKDVGLVRAAHLGRWAEGNIEHEVGRAGGNLLRQHEGDHLPFGVYIKRALDANDYIIRRAQPDRTTPGDAPALPLDHTMNVGNIQAQPAPWFPWCQRFRRAR